MCIDMHVSLQRIVSKIGPEKGGRQENSESKVVETLTYECLRIEFNCDFCGQKSSHPSPGTGWNISCGEVEIRSANEKSRRTDSADG